MQNKTGKKSHKWPRCWCSAKIQQQWYSRTLHQGAYRFWLEIKKKNTHTYKYGIQCPPNNTVTSTDQRKNHFRTWKLCVTPPAVKHSFKSGTDMKNHMQLCQRYVWFDNKSLELNKQIGQTFIEADRYPAPQPHLCFDRKISETFRLNSWISTETMTAGEEFWVATESACERKWNAASAPVSPLTVCMSADKFWR